MKYEPSNTTRWRVITNAIHYSPLLTKVFFCGSCKDTFNKFLNVGDYVDEISARLLQGIIAGMVIGGRDCEAGPFFTPNCLVGRKSLAKHKTLASLQMFVKSRAKKVLTDIKNRAEELDLRPRVNFRA